MVVLGLFAFAAQRTGFPTVPLILGFILANLVEANFHRALAVGFGSYSIFVVRPISLAMIGVTCLFAAWPAFVSLYRRRGGGGKPGAMEAIMESTAVSKGELYFAGLITLILLIFLSSASRYSSAVRLFPLIVSIIGLALTAYWFLIAARSTKIKPAFGNGASTANGIPAFLSLGFLVAYALMVPVAGFAFASVVFFLMVMFVSRQENRKKKHCGLHEK
jgi:hypothetical protein